VRWILFAVLVLLVAAAVWIGRPDPDEPAPEEPAELPREAGFIGSEACRGCHEERHRTWLDTAHAYSLRAPDDASVAGRFDGAPIEARYFVATPEKRADGWYVRVEGRGPSWRSGEYKVTHVIGRHFEQAYLFTGPLGEWRVLPICWSIERGEWDLTHEVLHDITGSATAAAEDADTREIVFNQGCGQCHATDYDVGQDVSGGGPPRFRTTYLEGAVACESCHGPGSVHARWHRRAEAGGPVPGYGEPARLLHPREDLDASGVLATCGRCHYLHDWRYAIADDPRVSFHDIAVSLNFDQPGFLADGRIDGLRYHGTTQSQSACYLKGGMSCLSCHRMHGGKRWALKFEEDDDAQCTQCHETGTYAGKGHTFHEDVRCVDCHMPKLLEPTRVLHFMRDHTIRSPEPEFTERFGRDLAPNACGVCHADKTARWARTWKEKWWGPLEDRQRLADVGTVVALRRDRSEVATAELAALAARATSPLFFRMTALRELGLRDGPAAREAVRRRLSDDHPEILQMAVQGAIRRPERAAGAALAKLLDHPVRTVRVDAAYALALAGWRATPAESEALWRDTEEMLVRRGGVTDELQRLVVIADATGRFEASGKYLAPLVRRAPAAAVDGIRRRARFLTDEGHHADALDAYGDAHALRDEDDRATLELLYVDSADSLAALGRLPEAAGNWRYLVESGEDDALAAIAEARLRALAGGAADQVERLEALAAELEDAPASGELLRRIRWALAVLRAR